MITIWDDDNIPSEEKQDDDDDEESSNYCFMAKDQGEKVTNSNSKNTMSYKEL